MAKNLSLQEMWNESVLRESLFSIQAWKPFATARERKPWSDLPANVRLEMIKLADEALVAVWPHVPATVYLQFSQNGNRTKYEDLHFGRRKILCDLLIGECVESQGRFLPAILDAAWSICEESSWCLPAHTGMQAAGVGLPDTTDPTVDLFASETAALLAWMVYLLGGELGQISPMILPRVKREVHQRILEPALTREDVFWMGFVERPVNNWNPWINSNWLACVLLLEEDVQRRLAATQKILRSLDVFLADYPEDGGCDEGPNYWGRAGASLFDCLELLYSASGGRLNVYTDPLIKNIGQYIYRAHIAGDYYLNFADASAVVQPDACLVWRYGKRIGDEAMADFGAWLVRRAGLMEHGYRPHKAGRSSSPTRELPALFDLAEIAGVKGTAPLPGDVWLPGLEVMAVRDQAGSEEGLYLAVKGGHNAESHNHNDIGHFVVYRDGRPLIIDAGVETYTRKTFSPQRYEIWTMQSSYHSLPTIDGYQQSAGREYRALNVRRDSSADTIQLTMELAQAYPSAAGVNSWIREVGLVRGSMVRVVDRYQFTRVPGSLTLSLMAVSAIDLTVPGRVLLGERNLPAGRIAGKGEIRYDTGRFQVSFEEVAVSDARMKPVWGNCVFRLVFTDLQPSQNGRWEFSFA